jgi:hypothetical protein
MTIEQPIEPEGPVNPAGSGALPRPTRILKAWAFVAVILGLYGCGDHDALPDMTKQVVKFDEVPENVRTAATKAIPGVDFKEAWKNLDTGGKLHSFEIRGKNATDGKTREVRVSLTGEILEME